MPIYGVFLWRAVLAGYLGVVVLGGPAVFPCGVFHEHAVHEMIIHPPNAKPVPYSSGALLLIPYWSQTDLIGT